MIPTEHIDVCANRLAVMEAEEPVVCAWRYHAGSRGTSSWPQVRAFVRAIRRLLWRLKPMQRPLPGQVVVLSNAATPATLGSLRPVMAELKRRGRSPFLVTTAATRGMLSEGLHHGHADLEQFMANLSPVKQFRIRVRAENLAEQVSSALSPHPDGAAITWIQRGLMARTAAKGWLGEAGAVMADSDIESWRKGFILGANELGIPTIVFQHGLFGGHHFPVHSSHLFTWGEYFNESVSEFDSGQVRCEPVGCPRWDGLLDLRVAPRCKILIRRLALDPSPPVVLLVSNTHGAKAYPDQYSAYIRGVSNLLETEMQVVVRLHPSEQNLDFYRDRIAPDLFERLAVCPQDLDIHQALKCCDVVYHVFSAAALESMLLGIPTLYERGDPGAKLCDFPEFGGGEWTSPSIVADRCSVLSQTGEDRRRLIAAQDRFLESAIGHQGRATQVAVDHLDNLCRKCAAEETWL